MESLNGENNIGLWLNDEIGKVDSDKDLISTYKKFKKEFKNLDPELFFSELKKYPLDSILNNKMNASNDNNLISVLDSFNNLTLENSLLSDIKKFMILEYISNQNSDKIISILENNFSLFLDIFTLQLNDTQLSVIDVIFF